MIEELSKKEAKEIARIHIQALAGDFLPSLGQKFLSTFYKGIIGEKGVFVFGQKEQGRVVGFVIGTDNSEKFFSMAIKKKFLNLTLVLLNRILFNPSLLLKVLQTFSYTKKESGPKAELIVIAVIKEYQGKGIGKKLINFLEKSFKKNSINSYKLSVHKGKESIKFYEHLNFKRISSFSLYGKMWYIYEKRL